jgi:hypothetical protein
MDEWEEDCLKWRDRVLTGKFAHWCFDWDGLPVDETCEEWPCDCQFEGEVPNDRQGRTQYP